MALLSWSLVTVTILLSFNSLHATTRPSGVYYTLCDSPQENTVWLQSPSASYYIRSHTYPSGTYQNNQNCRLVFMSTWKAMILYFNYTSFAVEFQQACSFDSLCVNGINYCGSWASGQTFGYIIQPFQTFTLVFKTDSSVVDHGFEIHVTAEIATNQTIDIPTGRVGSNPTTVNFTTVTYSPEYDYVDGCMHEASTTEATTTPVPIDNQTATTFPTGGETTSSQSVYDVCDNTRSNFVDITAASAPVQIFTPYYWRGYYSDNLFCSLVLRSGPEPLILSLNYKDFSLETSTNNCSFDYLCVHGVKFCGTSFPDGVFQYVLPAYSEFTLVFKTDGSVTRRGFQIEISQELAINQSITEAVGGVGDYRQNVVYENVTFPLEEPYKDGCAQSYTTQDQPAGTTESSTSSQTSVPSCLTPNVTEIYAEIDQLFERLYRVRSLLRQISYN